MTNRSDYQVIVVGAGHAGCEAALACARMGALTLLVTINLDTIALMPCNPSIGGQGKGQLVREIDALGGAMGCVADETCIQRRRLNTRKGIAVQANRFQSDKEAYGQKMTQVLLQQPNLHLLQGLAAELYFENDNLAGITLSSGDTIRSKAVIITAGTFLRGKIFIGETNFEAGRAGEPPSNELGQALIDLGLPIMRFKTGTPPRVDIKTVDFSCLERQDEDKESLPFSLWSLPKRLLPIRPCFITHTNADTHRVIRANLTRSALFSGEIIGTGTRYCPSIEDKLKKFPNKESHKVFLEPEGAYSSEIYLQGISTSLPEEVQEQYVQTIKGLENAQLTRPGYAIEYDIIDPIDLFPSLMSKSIPNLFLAGQVNGTSGYEEAAAQGLLAGINAAAAVMGKEQLVLDAQTSYLGLMVQEITTKGIKEPYRIFTSRSAFRLNLRMSNAEERLSEIGFKYGSVSQNNYSLLCSRLNLINSVQKQLEACAISRDRAAQMLNVQAATANKAETTAAKILKQPNISLSMFISEIPDISRLDALAALEVEARIKYEGYFAQQKKEFELKSTMANLTLSEAFINDLPETVSKEARLKIQAIKPETVARLAEIPAVRASDLVIILMKLKAANKGI